MAGRGALSISSPVQKQAREAELCCFLLCRNKTERLVPVAEHITGPALMTQGLEINERLGGKGVHVIPAKYMYPFHWLMTDPDSGGSEGMALLSNSLKLPL